MRRITITERKGLLSIIKRRTLGESISMSRLRKKARDEKKKKADKKAKEKREAPNV